MGLRKMNAFFNCRVENINYSAAIWTFDCF